MNVLKELTETTQTASEAMSQACKLSIVFLIFSNYMKRIKQLKYDTATTAQSKAPQINALERKVEECQSEIDAVSAELDTLDNELRVATCGFQRFSLILIDFHSILIQF